MEDAQLGLDCLTEALKEDCDAKGGVVVDEENTLSVMYYQSGHI